MSNADASDEDDEGKVNDYVPGAHCMQCRSRQRGKRGKGKLQAALRFVHTLRLVRQI